MENEVVIKGRPSISDHNKMMELGYKFMVEGDWKIGDDVDPWSGMPTIKSNTHYFMDRADAEAYAAKQIWPFNKDVHGTVKDVAHKETGDEFRARMDQEKADRQAKRAASDEKKAAEQGITVDQLNRERAKKSQMSRIKNEIAKHEAELERLRAELAKYEG